MAPTGKKRLPLLQLLTQRYPSVNKDTLYSSVLCGEVFVDGGAVRDPKEKIFTDSEVEIAFKKYVSRGGEKLETAFTAWNFPVEGKVFIDAGSSTGGFTDFLLQHGAAAVHCVDVGYNQLDYSLRCHSRVYVHEKTNILDFTHPDPAAHAAVGDLSFRSLSGAVAHVLSLTSEKWGIFLLKPQFELRDPVENFNGVIKDKKIIKTVLRNTLVSLACEGVSTVAVVPSAVQGRKGNQEYLCYLKLEDKVSGCVGTSGIMELINQI